jgi:hypothetical protein
MDKVMTWVGSKSCTIMDWVGAETLKQGNCAADQLYDTGLNSVIGVGIMILTIVVLENLSRTAQNTGRWRS